MASPESNMTTLDLIKSEGLAISQRELVNVFGPKASGNLNAAEIQKLYQDMPGFLARNQERDEIFGTHEGLISRSGKKDEDHRRLVEQRKAQGEKGGGIDIAFLQMIQDGHVGAYIGQAVFGNMSDEEIDAVIAEIELETGKPFEEYAAEILADKMPERKPEESDRDYDERVLVALSDEMLEVGSDGKLRVKAQYEDDPTAKVLKRSEEYKETEVKIQNVNDAISASGPNAETDALVTEIIEKDAASARMGSDELANASYEEQAELGTDTHCDDDFAQEDKVERSGSFLNAKFGAAASGEAPKILQEAEVKLEEDIAGKPNPPIPT